MAAVPGYAGTKTSARGLYSGGGHASGREHRPSFQSSVFSIEEILIRLLHTYINNICTDAYFS